MFSLSLGLALLPFVSAASYDVQVGQDGLNFTPDAIVRLPFQLYNPFSPFDSSSPNLVTKSSFTSIQKITPSSSPPLPLLVASSLAV
jgi:hypothetical protein